jgi:GNAT superfamily N-acetyltransferase
LGAKPFWRAARRKHFVCRPHLDISRSRYLELTTERKRQLEGAARAEFEQFPIVSETHWATPDWSFLAIEGAELAAFYNIIERAVNIDGVPVRVAGLNELVTLPAHRGRGVASRLLRETQTQWFDSLGTECGLLLCADALLPFYSRLGWHKSDARVIYDQPDGPRDWTANCMLLEPSGKARAARKIHLCGLPW